MKCAIEKLVLESRCQARAEIRPEAVEDYAAAYAAKAKIPPISIFLVDGAPLVVDGFHRVAAAVKAGVSFVEVVQVGSGTLDDAAWYATGVNQSHGVRRSNADKRKAVLMALTNPRAQERSNRNVAEHCGVSDALVADIRKEIEAPTKSLGFSDDVQESRTSPEKLNSSVKPTVRKDSLGRLQPAKKPRQVERCAEFPEDEATPTEESQLRASGVEPPAYGPLLTKAANKIKQLRISLRSELEDVPSFAQQTERLLKDAETALRLGIPEVCPRCGGSKCDQCAHRGWVGKGLAEQIRARGKL